MPGGHHCCNDGGDGSASLEVSPLDVQAAVEMAAGPALALSLSRAMFAGFDDVDERYDVERAKGAQLTLMLRMLRASPPGAD